MHARIVATQQGVVGDVIWNQQSKKFAWVLEAGAGEVSTQGLIWCFNDHVYLERGIARVQEGFVTLEAEMIGAKTPPIPVGFFDDLSRFYREFGIVNGMPDLLSAGQIVDGVWIAP